MLVAVEVLIWLYPELGYSMLSITYQAVVLDTCSRCIREPSSRVDLAVVLRWIYQSVAYRAVLSMRSPAEFDPSPPSLAPWCQLPTL